MTDLDWEILVVDDGSDDGTAAIVSAFGKLDPRVRFLLRTQKRGLAGAVLYGWANTSAELLGVMDADLQHPPELIKELLAELQKGADLVIASRYTRAHSMDSWNPLRRTLSKLGVLASIPVQKRSLKVKDPLSGFFVLRRECIAGIQFQDSGFKLLLEILAKGNVGSVAEVPFTFGSRQFGKSKAGAMTGFAYASLLLKLFKYAFFRSRD